MSSINSKRPHRPRPTWAAWFVVIVAVAASAAYAVPACRPAISNVGPPTGGQTGPGAAAIFFSGTFQCVQMAGGVPCWFCLQDEIDVLSGPFPLHWRTLFGAYQDYWSESCGAGHSVTWSHNMTGLQTGNYRYLAAVYYGTCAGVLYNRYEYRFDVTY